MTLTIKQLLNYSWMSQASYLDFSGLPQGASGSSFESILINNTINKSNEFATEQAKFFTGSATPGDSTDGFSFVNYAPDYQSTGFSATVFKSNADASYTIAVRGTEPPGQSDSFNDLVRADALGVVLQGAALEQLFVGYRYYKQLTSTGHSSYYQQELTAMASLLVTASDKNFSNKMFFVSPIASLISSWVSGSTFAERVQSMVSVIQPILSNDAGLGCVDISPFLFCTRRGKGYINETTGTCAGWKSLWQRFYAKVMSDTKIEQRFTEHDIRAKVASDADSLQHATELLSHSDPRTTERIYRRKATKVNPMR